MSLASRLPKATQTLLPASAADHSWGVKRTPLIRPQMSANDPKRTFLSPLLKRKYRVNLVEHLLHDCIGWRLAVE
jgi:hypothetical protein